MPLRNLDTILKHKRNLPKAKRLLKSSQYQKLFKVHCPRLLKYTECRCIAHAVSIHVMKKINKRMKDKEIISMIFKELRMLPLQIKLSRPGRGITTPKMKWHHIRIKDTYIREALRWQLRKRGYTASNCGDLLVIHTW